MTEKRPGNRLFRKVALERLSLPEQLDQLMAVTGPRGWIALAGIGLLLLIAILWSVLGRVATRVSTANLVGCLRASALDARSDL